MDRWLGCRRVACHGEVRAFHRAHYKVYCAIFVLQATPSPSVSIMTRMRDDLPALARRQTSRSRTNGKDASAILMAGPDPSRLWGRPGFLIRRLHQIHYGLFFEECGHATITPLQFGMLTVLAEHPKGIDIGALAFQ